MTFFAYPILHPFHPSSCTGERGLEVCCHGDRSPLPVDLCVCVCVRHNGHVPAAAIPELHSQDHHPHSRLTVPLPQTHWQTAPPTNQHSRTRGSNGGAGLGFIVSVNWNENWNSTAITPIIFIVTFFEMNSNVSCMKKKENTLILSCSFLSRCLMD